MDEVVQVTPEVPQVLETEPVKKPFSIKNFLNNASWIALFVLTPLTFIILLSQNANPGDLLYPVKRIAENTVLAAVTVNPSTKAFFHTDLADRRFSEAEKLLLAQSNTAPLTDLVSQIQDTQAAIENVSNPAQKEELTNKVIAQINTYQAKLTSTEAQIQQNFQSSTTTPTNAIVTSAPVSQPTTAPANTKVVVVVVTVTQSPTPVPAGSSRITASVTSVPAQTTSIPTQISVTPTQNPTSIPTAIPTFIPPQTIQQVKVARAIEDTNQQLEKIKQHLQQQQSKQLEQQNTGSGNNPSNNSSSENKTTH